MLGRVVGKECRDVGNGLGCRERGGVAHANGASWGSVLWGWARAVDNSSGVVVGYLSQGGVLVGWVSVGGVKFGWASERIYLGVGWVSGGCLLGGKLVLLCVKSMVCRVGGWVGGGRVG